MTRGRRDGILKSEKVRHVVKIGPMHLKGVWIPFERALDFANKEKITDQLYPLFVHNIGSLLYTPESINRTSQVVTASEQRRRIEAGDTGRPSQAPQPSPLPHHHSMQSSVGSQPQHSIAPNPSAGRPGIDRAHTFPTPPTSASSVLGMGNQSSSYNWDGQNLANNVASSQPLSIDTGLSNNARSMPTTPATTPPGGAMPYQGQQGYDQKPYAAYPPASQNGYAPQPRMNTYPQDPSFKSEMGPPSAPGAVPAEGEHHDSKADVYGHVNGAPDSGHHEQGYADPNASAYNANRSHYAYNPAPGHQHVSPEMTGSPSHQTNSGRGTPRTMPAGQQQWSQDFQTPPRSAPTSSVYSVMGDSRSSNGGSGEYTASSYSASSQPATSNKRGRDDDEHDRPVSRDVDYKRQKSYGAPMGSANHMQAIATGGGMPRQR
jgi:enhanced filamentous growth protein 1